MSLDTMIDYAKFVSITLVCIPFTLLFWKPHRNIASGAIAIGAVISGSIFLFGFIGISGPIVPLLLFLWITAPALLLIGCGGAFVRVYNREWSIVPTGIGLLAFAGDIYLKICTWGIIQLGVV